MWCCCCCFCIIHSHWRQYNDSRFEHTIEAQKAQIHRLLAAKDEADKKFSEELHQLEVKFSDQKKGLRIAEQQCELKTEEVCV